MKETQVTNYTDPRYLTATIVHVKVFVADPQCG